MTQKLQLVLVTEDARDVDHVARIATSVILNEGRVDCPPMKSTVGRQEHTGVGARIAIYFIQIRILSAVEIRPVPRLVPYANKSNEHDERPIYDDRPGTHICICPQRIRIFQTRSFLPQTPKCSRPVQ